jgi:hypothetical protein
MLIDYGTALMVTVTSSVSDAQTALAFRIPLQMIVDALLARLRFPTPMMPCRPS